MDISGRGPICTTVPEDRTRMDGMRGNLGLTRMRFHPFPFFPTRPFPRVVVSEWPAISCPVGWFSLGMEGTVVGAIGSNGGWGEAGGVVEESETVSSGAVLSSIESSGGGTAAMKMWS